MEKFERLALELSRRCPTLELRREEPMARHTTFRVGGPAALMALPKTEEEAVCAVQTAAELGTAPFFMGNGSNLLAPDEGVRRFLVKTADGLSSCRREGNRLIAGSGVALARLASLARDEGLTGLEFAHGIPGSLGGAVTMNAGAYGGEMVQVVSSVACLTPAGALERIAAADCSFGYRRSAFSDGSRMILGAWLELTPGERGAIQARMDELAVQRRAKQPLEYPSAGSTFKRPAGHFAAALIDRCGLKGLTVGGAQVSEKHAGFLVNRGGATCADILALAEQVKTRVLAQTGVELELEVKILR